MPDFTAARTNMVDCQIHPSGIITPGILNAFLAIPREKFVSEDFQNIAYSDNSIPAGNGRALLEPATHAKMLQAAEPLPSERILDIGGGTGYPAAILSFLTHDVTALEEPDLIGKARMLWHSLGINNIEGIAGKFSEGAPGSSPFDLIILNGAVTEIPPQIVNQLSRNGRMICILKKAAQAPGQVILVKRNAAASYSTYALFEAAAEFLPGFETKPVFQF